MVTTVRPAARSASGTMEAPRLRSTKIVSRWIGRSWSSGGRLRADGKGRAQLGNLEAEVLGGHLEGLAGADATKHVLDLDTSTVEDRMPVAAVRVHHHVCAPVLAQVDEARVASIEADLAKEALDDLGEDDLA